MKKVSLILWVSVMIVSLFESCQKEKYDNVHLVLVADAPVSTSASDDYTLTGRIISSGKIDLTDYGFDVEAGTEKYHYSLGDIQKSGKVQKLINIPNGGVTISKITMYAYDKYGNYYSSEQGATAPTDPLINPLTIEVVSHTSDTQYEYFSANIANSSSSTYSVMAYGIDYYDPKTTTSWSGRYPFYTGPNALTNASIDVNGQITISGGPFTMATNYAYRYYVVVMRNSDGLSAEYYSTTSSFTSAAL